MAQVTLRPDGVGSSSQCGTGGATPGWNCCDEVSPDGFTTFVSNAANPSWLLDLYALPDPALSGVINSVTIYSVIRAEEMEGTRASARGAYKTNGVTYYYGSFSGGNAWYARNTGALVNNPQTSSPWTWDEVDALEIGVSLRAIYEDKIFWMSAWGTQVYVVVDYIPGWSGKISGVTNPDKIMGVSVTDIVKVKGVA